MGRTYPPFRNQSPDDEIRELIAERDALNVDAERYWWLRKIAYAGPFKRFVREYAWWEVSAQTTAHFDAAIDAAMKDKP